MKLYIATTLSNAPRAQQVRDAFQAAGHTITYSWMDHGPVGHEGKERLEEVAMQEMFGVTVAEVVVVLLPGGKGTHTELGMAIAMGKPIIIWDEPGGSLNCDNQTCSFYHLPGICQLFSGELHDEAIALLIATAEQVVKQRRLGYVVR